MIDVVCEHCGRAVLNTGYMDKDGCALFVGDKVLIRWARMPPTHDFEAIATIVKNDNENGNPVYIELVPGTIKDLGELVDEGRQKWYRMERGMRDSKMCEKI